MGKLAVVNQQQNDADNDAGNEAFYGKLRRVPSSLSEAFLREVTDRFTALFPKVVAHRIPTSFDRLDVIILDGKSLKKVVKRLVETRGTPGKLLGGKLLVAYRPRDGLVLDSGSVGPVPNPVEH